VKLSAWFVCAALMAGCNDVTPEKIETWKGTEKGPGKLRDAVKNASVAPALRAQALVALVELSMASEAIDDLHRGSDADRQAVAKEAAPRLAQLAGTGNGVTTRQQRGAKDALFLVRADTTGDDRAKADDALIAWTCADLAGRSQQGDQSTDKILTAIGPRAVPKLIEILSDDGANQIFAAALVGKIGDATSKVRAADVLVDAGKRAVTRTHDVSEGLLMAISSIGGAHAVAFMVDQGEHGPELVRKKALLALSKGNISGDANALAAAARLAADQKAPNDIRDAAFEVAEKVGPTAVPKMIELMKHPQDLIRWRAVEAALSAGGPGAVKPVLEALDPKKKYKPDDLDSFVVHDLQMVGKPAVPALQEELKSANPVAKQVAQKALSVIK
jgi:hypothetical protein